MALHGDDDDVLSLSSPGPGSDYHFEAQVFQPVNSSSHGGGIIYHSQTESRVIRTSSWKRKSISILRCDVHWAVVGLLPELRTYSYLAIKQGSGKRGMS